MHFSASKNSLASFWEMSFQYKKTPEREVVYLGNYGGYLGDNYE
jgi:hypothetical protein